MTLKCGECERIIPEEHRSMDDDIVILYCPSCKLTYRIPITLSDADVSHDVEDALTDVYWG